MLFKSKEMENSTLSTQNLLHMLLISRRLICCPFCRKDFKYNHNELKEKNKLNIDYSNWQPPTQLILPNGFNEIIRVNNRNNQNNDNQIQIDEIDYSRNPEFSRLNMNRIRRRRRNLSMKEIQERRKRIKKKCKKK